ncbi:MAG: DUF1003 domain-containing protein [Methylobacteriaceae bacterium]|nr:DUF1003 domain-containing protein [Methylobacteriaceae bacterium]
MTAHEELSDARWGRGRIICAIAGEETPRRSAMPFAALSPGLQDRILKDHPALKPDSLIGRKALDRYRIMLLEEMIAAEKGELSTLERNVAESLASNSTISANSAEQYEQRRSTGEIWADRIASFGGSWTFLGLFALTLAAWMGLNAALAARAFDPYPYILLNLVLSCLAAVQAPIIMMSQKRQESKDRLRAMSDYQVNLKAELEIRHLHDKIDHLLSHQWERLAEIQRMQVELLQERRG